MKVCVQPPQPPLSRSLQRIADALARTAPAEVVLGFWTRLLEVL